MNLHAQWNFCEHCTWEFWKAKINELSNHRSNALDTLGLGPEVWRALAKCHDIRNLIEYEGDVHVDDRILQDLLTATTAVMAKLDTCTPLSARRWVHHHQSQT